MPKLLVIDDEPGIHFSIRRVFADEDLLVISAESAEEGVRLAAAESPDMILLDIRLGDRSGLEVFRELRRIEPALPDRLHHRLRHHRYGHRSHETGSL